MKNLNKLYNIICCVIVTFAKNYFFLCMPKASIGCLDVARILIMVNKLSNHMCIGMGMIGAINTIPFNRTLGPTKISYFLITSV